MRVVWGLGLIVLLVCALAVPYLITECWQADGYWTWTGCVSRG